MNDLAAQLALDDAAVREGIHEAQEGEGDEESEEGSEVGVHSHVSFIELFILTL